MSFCGTVACPKVTTSATSCIFFVKLLEKALNLRNCYSSCSFFAIFSVLLKLQELLLRSLFLMSPRGSMILACINEGGMDELMMCSSTDPSLNDDASILYYLENSRSQLSHSSSACPCFTANPDTQLN